MNFVAIDFETANRYRNSACSMALVTVENGKVTDTVYKLIRPPELTFDYWNIRIHGITAKDVVDQPTFAELWDEIKPLLENKIVIAHNAAFDISVLRSILNEYGLEHPMFKHACTVDLSKKVWPGQESYKLSSLAEKFSLSFNHHHALDDAKTCARVALLAAEATKSPTFANLVDVMNLKLKDFKA